MLLGKSDETMMGRMASVAMLLIILAVCIMKVEADCNNQAEMQKCFLTSRKRPQQSSRGDPNEVTVKVFIRAFEDGVTETCNFLDAVIQCTERAISHCNAPLSGSHFSRMKAIKKYVCVTKKNEFVSNEACVTSSAVKSGIDNCEKPLKSGDNTCRSVKQVVECLDSVMESNCPEVALSFGHLTRNYLRDRLELHSCDITHKDDHQHTDEDGHDHSDDGHHHENDGHDHGHSGSADGRQLYSGWLIFGVLSIIAAIL